MSAEKYKKLLREWHKVQDSVEQGKIHAANQKRFDQIEQPERKMRELDLSREECVALGKEVHHELYPQHYKS